MIGGEELWWSWLRKDEQRNGKGKGPDEYKWVKGFLVKWCGGCRKQHSSSFLEAQAHLTVRNRTVNWKPSLSKFARIDEENRERKMEKQNEEEEEQKKKKKSSVVIRIPSYQEVVESSQAKSTPSSLFVPSQTFSEAFAFVKSSDFYSPPPKSRYTRFPFPHLKCLLIIVINLISSR